MKIVFFRHSLLNRGGDRMVLAHAACLADHSHEVVIRTGRVDTVFPVDPRFRVEKTLSDGIPSTLWFAALEHDPSAVYVADIVVLSLLLSLRNRGRVLFFAQGYDEFNCAFLPGRWLIRILLFLALRVIGVPVVAVSDHLARFLRKKYRADATVVPNGIDPVFFLPPESPCPFASRKNGRPVVLLHARRDHAKGFDTAVAVLRLLAARFPQGVEVWTVGEEVAPLLDFVPRCHFGYVSAATLAQLMSAADVFLYPSRHEGFALAVLEAFSRRCPVVTTQAVYFARHEVNAMVADPDDSEALASHLERVVREPELREEIVAGGYAVALGFDLAGSTRGFQEALSARFADLMASRERVDPAKGDGVTWD
jgi:glycosyltransferase involved in cell wall biosynthesis